MNRKEICRRMEVLEIEEELMDCLRDIYEETKVQVKIRRTKVGELMLD